MAKIHEEMSQLFDKEVNAQKESLKKTLGVHASSRKPTKKCAMKMKERKNDARKNVFDARRAFIGRLWQGGLIDCKEPQVDDW